MIHQKLTKSMNINLRTMNKIIAGIIVLLAAATAQAQNPSGRNVSTYHANLDTAQITDIRERLVQLALQNPNFEIADRNVNVANYQLSRAKGAWLGALSATGNVNEYTINPKSAPSNQATLYPKYNFSLNLPLDFFTSRGNEVKIARENVYIAAAEKNERYRTIRNQVLSKYEDYLMHKEKLEIQTRMTQSEYTDYKLAEQNFSDGLITPDVFKKAETAYYEQQMRKLDYQRNFNIARLDLEQMIGLSIDDVLGKK
jgi:outer membrane protein TolC